MTDQELYEQLLNADKMNKLAQDEIRFGEITGEIDYNMLVKNAALQGFVKGVFCERYGFDIAALDQMIKVMKEKLGIQNEE